MNKSLVTGFFCVLLISSGLYGDTVTDEKYGFTLNLSSDFIPRPGLVGATPDTIHAFQYGEAAENEFGVFLFIEKMGGVIGRSRLNKESMPPNLKGELLKLEWQDFDVGGFRILEKNQGFNTFIFFDTVIYNVQIPLKHEAIQLKLVGPVERDASMEPLLRQIIDGLEGESNWIPSMLPSSLSDSQNYRTVSLCVGLGSVVVGLVFLWFVSLKTPKGTILIVAVTIYLLSLQLPDIRVVEMKFLIGIIRLFAITGGILGIIDMCRKRKTTPGQDSTVES